MHRFQKVGVFLRNTPIDEAVLAFAAHLGKLGAQEIHCVLVADSDKGTTAPPPTDEAFTAQIHAALPDDMTARTTCEVRPGHHLEQMLRFARDADLDLAIIGRKLPSSQVGLGTKVARIVRKAPCSVMVVPELCRPHFGRILVAVDCSEHSRMAIETAVALAKASGERNPQLLAVTVRRVATRYDLAGVTFDESADAQREHGQHDLDAFLGGIDSEGIPIEAHVLLSEESAMAITHVAMARKMDIVVAGSRGATRSAAALLGSTSEELLMACAMPILIVKKKGETLHLLEALFTID